MNDGFSLKSFFKTRTQHIIWRIEVFFYDISVFILHFFSVDSVSNSFGKLFKHLGPLTKRHKVSEKSMKIAFPKSTKEERHVWLLGMWENMGRILGEFLCLKQLADQFNQGKINVEIDQEAKQILQKKIPIIFLSGHFANWEILLVMPKYLDLSCQITYRAMNNPYFDQRVKKLREKIGLELLTPKSGLKGGMELVRSLKQGKSLFFMGDQKYNEGLEIPFFGKNAMMLVAPLRIALKTKTPIIPIICKRDKGTQFTVRMYPPIYKGSHDLKIGQKQAGKQQKSLFHEDEVINLAIKLNQFYENRIKEKPEDWFWLHRRWPKSFYLKNSE